MTPLATQLLLAAISPTNSVLLVVGLLLVAVLIASVAILTLRKNLFAPPAKPDDPGSLMDQIRDMRDRGEISADEYDRVRRRLVANAASREPASLSENPDASGRSSVDR